jgi:threonine dehydrogenase-like Zn-dependent dehydrogenase
MKALVFDYKLPRLALAKIAGIFNPRGYFNPWSFLRYTDIPDAPLLADDWVVIRTRSCGICGSDHKQVFLDGNVDNPMTAVISWPQVLGHEVVGTVEKVGPKVTRVRAGDRVALNPWLSCLPRGIDPPCPACREGKNTLCRNFTRGRLAPGIHTGNSRDATGGFAEFVPAHETMAVPIPVGVTWDQAVLSDPFSVAFHSVLKVTPFPGSVCAVYGCGNLGLLTVHILKRVFRDVRVIAVARFPHQAAMARRFGADLVLDSAPERRIIEEVARFVGCDVYAHRPGRPWLLEGVDTVFDTVASPRTLATGIRIVKARAVRADGPESGAIVVTGVASPRRFEWTPWYFKDVRVIGSNAFAVETFEGRTEHAYSHYFRFLADGRVDPVAMLTHRFPLARYKDALIDSHEQGRSGALKVLFEFPGPGGDGTR